MVDAQIAEQLAMAIGIIVAVSLALGTALGGLVLYLTEAVKATGRVPAGYGGIISLAVAVLLGIGMGALTKLLVPDGPSWPAMILIGAVAGAIMAANAVKSFKAVGSVNTMPAYIEGEVAGTKDAFTETATTLRENAKTMANQSQQLENVTKLLADDKAAVKVDGAVTNVDPSFLHKRG